MNVKFCITLLILLVTNLLMCISSLRSIIGPDHRKFFQTCNIPNPYVYTLILIFIRNVWIIIVRKNFFNQLYNLSIVIIYSALIFIRKKPINCNATSTIGDIITSSVFLILALSNPSIDFLNHIQHIKFINKQRNHQPKPACSCTNKRKLRKKATISVLKSISNFDTDSYPSVTNSDILITSSRLDKVDQETQTIVGFESKFCQHPNKDSLHFLRGNIPVQLIERSNVEEKFKVQSEMISMKNKFVDCKNGIGDVKIQSKMGSVHENNPLLNYTDAGDSDLKNSQIQRQFILNTLKSHINKHLNHMPPTPQSRIQTRNVDTGIVKIEDLISENGDFNLSMVPTKDVVVPKEVPKAVATALESMVVKSNVQNIKSLFQSNLNESKVKLWNKELFRAEQEYTAFGDEN